MGKRDETMLIYVDSVNNNNKFYHVTLDENDVVTKRWGRVGSDGAVSTEHTGYAGYERAIRAKEKKGYKKTQVNATHVTTSTALNNMSLESVAQKHLSVDPTNTFIAKLISRLVAANKHQIMEKSGGQIKISDDGIVRTALGIVNQGTINEARILLNRLMQAHTNMSLLSDLERYLTLIPQDVGRRRGWHEDFLKAENLNKQSDFLNQLESSVQWYNQTLAAAQVDANKDEAEKDHSDLFRMRLGYLDKSDPRYKHIEKAYLKSRNLRHTSSNLKLVNVYTVEDKGNEEAFQKAVTELGNVKELWHGTSVANILSILTKGLFIPKSGGGDGIQIAGRMFGDALYFSPQSSKSLNYSTGFWHGSRQNSNCFMFFNDIVMGNEFRPTHWDYTQQNKAYKGTDSAGKRYNSISVKGGTCRVLNDEIMVWNTDQINLKYLCEFSE
jgi:poly [ADP-ribose] polymerase